MQSVKNRFSIPFLCDNPLYLTGIKSPASALVGIEEADGGIDSKRDYGSRFDSLRGHLRRS